jgi:hypothetical protein
MWSPSLHDVRHQNSEARLRHCATFIGSDMRIEEWDNLERLTMCREGLLLLPFND